MLYFRLITAAAEVGACPLHSHEKYKALYEKLAESSHEESDMEPSDAESDDGNLIRQQQQQQQEQQQQVREWSFKNDVTH